MLKERILSKWCPFNQISPLGTGSQPWNFSSHMSFHYWISLCRRTDNIGRHIVCDVTTTRQAVWRVRTKAGRLVTQKGVFNLAARSENAIRAKKNRRERLGHNLDTTPTATQQHFFYTDYKFERRKSYKTRGLETVVIVWFIAYAAWTAVGIYQVKEDDWLEWW